MNTKPAKRRDVTIAVPPETYQSLERIAESRRWTKRFVLERLVAWFAQKSPSEQMMLMYPDLHVSEHSGGSDEPA